MSICLLAGVSVGVGCQRTPAAVERSQTATRSLVDTRNILIETEETVARSQTAIKTLQQSSGDPAPAFENFLREVQAVQARHAVLKEEAATVRVRVDWYSRARLHDIGTISNPELRRLAEQRAAAVRAKLDDIAARYDALEASLGSYLHSLEDLRIFLSNELNAPNLRSATAWLNESSAYAGAVRVHLRSLASEVDLASNSISPVPVPTTLWGEPVDTSVVARK